MAAHSPRMPYRTALQGMVRHKTHTSAAKSTAESTSMPVRRISMRRLFHDLPPVQMYPMPRTVLM